MKTITIEDCKELHNEFNRYADNAEQHEFPILAMVDLNLRRTIEQYELDGIEDQKEARAMFRTVLKTIGKDYSEYEEDVR